MTNDEKILILLRAVHKELVQIGHPQMFVTYDDAANGIPDVQGQMTDLELFAKAVEAGKIKNVRAMPGQEVESIVDALNRAEMACLAAIEHYERDVCQEERGFGV